MSTSTILAESKGITLSRFEFDGVAYQIDGIDDDGDNFTIVLLDEAKSRKVFDALIS